MKSDYIITSQVVGFSDNLDNELLTLEIIHNYVELLDQVPATQLQRQNPIAK